MKKVYSRPNSLKPNPFYYCPGCGHSLVHRLICEVIDEMDLRERIIGVPPPGCSVMAYNYFIKKIDNFITDMELCASETMDLVTLKSK